MSSLIPEAGCGRRPHIIFLLLMPGWYAKNLKRMYRNEQTGNTIIRKEIRQHKSSAIRQQISTYLIHINKDFLPIDTRFFTASTYYIQNRKIHDFFPGRNNTVITANLLINSLLYPFILPTKTIIRQSAIPNFP